MSDNTADFFLRLHNKVSGPATAMGKSLKRVTADMRDNQKVFAKGESEFEKKLKERRRLSDKVHGQELRQLREKKRAREREAAKAARLAARPPKAVPGGVSSISGVSAAGMIGGIGAAAGLAIAGAAIAAGALAANFVSATVAAVDFGQRSKTALTSILKDAGLASQQFGQVRREAGAMGLDVMGTVDQFKMLANSGFQVPMARELVRMSADLQALTGSSESAQFALRAISQIKMKGRLQAEEITGQLAEHGVSADEVYKELGKTLGKTRDEILKMQKAGDLSADVAIPAILQAVRNQLGVEQSGGFAMKINASSVGGMWRTLKGQVQNAFISLGEQVGPGITRAFGSIMASIQAAIAGPKVQALGGAVVRIFDSISSLIGGTDFGTLLTQAADSLGQHLTAAATFIRDHGAELRATFVTFVQFMGTTLNAAIDFMRPFVELMNSPFGRFMMTPLNETMGAGVVDTLEERRRAKDGSSPVAPTNAPGVAGQAGKALAGNKFGNINFGDIHVSLDAKTPEGAAGDLMSEVRRQMNAMLQDI